MSEASTLLRIVYDLGCDKPLLFQKKKQSISADSVVQEPLHCPSFLIISLYKGTMQQYGELFEIFYGFTFHYLYCGVDCSCSNSVIVMGAPLLHYSTALILIIALITLPALLHLLPL